MDVENSSDRVVRLSFFWLLAASLLIVGMAVAGGLLGARLWPARPPLTAPDTGQLFSTVQEVTISPSTAAADVLNEAQRSVVLITTAAEGAAATAAGVVVTNDGLVVTAAALPQGELALFDYLGKQLVADYIGRDELFGLSYLRVRDGLLLPLDLRANLAPVAYQLLLVGRSSATLTPKTMPFAVLEHTLPPELAFRGIRLMLRGGAISDAELNGGALVDDEGKLAGLIVSPQAGLALPADQLRESIDRVAQGRRESNPFVETGLTLRYTFATLQAGEARRFAFEVVSVAPNSPAAVAGFTRGDFIRRVGDQDIDWNQSAVALLSRPRPLPITVQRVGGETTLTLAP